MQPGNPAFLYPVSSRRIPDISKRISGKMCWLGLFRQRPETSTLGKCLCAVVYYREQKMVSEKIYYSQK